MKTIGKISGGIGLLVLITSPFTLFLTSGSWLAAGIKAAVGACLLIFWLLTRPPRDEVEVKGAMGSGARAGFFYSSSVMMILVLMGALAGVNFIAAKRGKTWDLTTRQIHSLAPQTTQALKALKAPVKVLAFLPGGHLAFEEFEPIFKKYAEASEKFTFEFKDPTKTPDLVAKYQLREGQLPVVLTQGGGTEETHTNLSADSLNEEALTRAIVKLNTVGTQKVYFVIGHGEWTLGARKATSLEDPSNFTSASRFKASLVPEGYAPEELNLAQSRDIPRDASLLIIAGASVKYSEREVALLEEYLAQGGRLLYFAELGREPGLDGLLGRHGIQVDNGVLTEDPRNPYVIVSSTYGQHEISKPLMDKQLNVQMATARGLSMLKEGVEQGVTVTPIATTSVDAWEETNPGDQRPTLDSGEKSGAIPIVIASIRQVADSVPNKRFEQGRLVVFGDAELITDALIGYEPGRNLVMNSVAWASNQLHNITIRPPDRDLSTIDLDDAMLATIRFLSMDLLPVLMAGIGLAIWLTRRNK
jgi:ABC-type uncharacterized transport system involved in gliding motility auxiliary subunit